MQVPEGKKSAGFFPEKITCLTNELLIELGREVVIIVPSAWHKSLYAKFLFA